MSFSPKEQEIIDWGLANNKSKEEVKQALSKFRATQPTVTETEQGEPEVGGFAAAIRDIPGDIKEAGATVVDTLRGGLETTKEAAEQVAQGEITRGAGAVKAGGATAKALLTAPFEAILGLAKIPFSPEAEANIAGVVQELSTGFGEQISEKNKRIIENLEAEAAANGGNAQEALNGIKQMTQKYQEDPTFKAYVDGASDFAVAGAEAVGLKTAGKVRKLSPELDSPYFQGIEQSVSEAISNVRSVNDRARVGEVVGTPGVQSPAVNNLTGRNVADSIVDTALVAAQKTVQSYRDLVDSAQTRIVRNLDNQAIRENASLPIKDVEQNIQQMYVNAVSPGVKGKRVTTEGITANKEQAVQAIRGITLNRDNIEFRDLETNEIVSGELPTNLWEFGGAVTDRKSKVYQEVLTEIGKAADEPVDTSRIIDAMTDIIDDPVYSGETAIVNRARQALEKYAMTDYTPMQLEDLIKLENDKLQSFYRGSGSQADAIVSAIVANNLRDMLDEAVEAATGSGVRPLKQEYGNLKAIERDVVHRALHNAQARDAGLVDMFGIRTIGDVSAGMAGDLGALRRGAGQIVGEGFIKALNDRDAMINRMFMVADQAYTGQTPTTLTQPSTQ